MHCKYQCDKKWNTRNLSGKCKVFELILAWNIHMQIGGRSTFNRSKLNSI